MSELNDNFAMLFRMMENMESNFNSRLDSFSERLENSEKRTNEFVEVLSNSRSNQFTTNPPERQSNSNFNRGATEQNDTFLLANTTRDRNVSDGRRISQLFQAGQPSSPPVSSAPVNPQANSFLPSIRIEQYDHFEKFPKTYKTFDVVNLINMEKDIKAFLLTYPHNANGNPRPFGYLEEGAQKFFWSRLHIGKERKTLSSRALMLLPDSIEDLLAYGQADFEVLALEVIKPLDTIELVMKINDVITHCRFPTDAQVAAVTSGSSRTAGPDFWMGMIDTLKFYKKAISMLLISVEESLIPKLVDSERRYEFLNQLPIFSKGDHKGDREQFKGLETLLRMKFGSDFFAHLKSTAYGPGHNIPRRQELTELLSRLLLVAEQFYKEVVAYMPVQQQLKVIANMNTTKSAPALAKPFFRRPSTGSTYSNTHSVVLPQDTHEERDTEEVEYFVDDGHFGYSVYDLDVSEFDSDGALYSMQGRNQTQEHPASSLRAGGGGGKPSTDRQLYDYRSKPQSAYTLSGKPKNELACFQLFSQGTCSVQNCPYSHDPKVLLASAQRIYWNIEYLAFLCGEPALSTSFGEPKLKTASPRPKNVPKSIFSIPSPETCPDADFPFAHKSAPRSQPSTPRYGSVHGLSPGVASPFQPPPGLLTRKDLSTPNDDDN